MKAKSDEENKGGGAADARRWNGLRNVVESRALLKTAFRTASTLKAQVQDIQHLSTFYIASAGACAYPQITKSVSLSTMFYMCSAPPVLLYAVLSSTRNINISALFQLALL